MKRTAHVVFGLLVLGCWMLAAACAAGETAGPDENGCGEESCDGFDNDCDGLIDEDGVCGPCDPGDTKQCYSGSPSTVDVGVCRRGTMQCIDGNWGGTCAGEITPVAEVCKDQLDNNCDGQIDNGCGGAGGYGQADFAGSGQRGFDFDASRVPLPAAGDQPVVLRLDFSWQDVATRPPPFDLSVRLSGVAGSLVQVFSVGNQPFARIGTRAKPLQANLRYRIELSRSSRTVSARVLRADDDAIVLTGLDRQLEAPAGDAVMLVTPTTNPRVRLGEPSTE